MAEAAAVAMVVGTAYSVSEQHKAYKAEKKAGAAHQAQADAEAARQREQALRQARIQRARIQNVAAQTGVQDSAGAMGATMGVGTQTAANLSFLDASTRRAQQVTGYLQQGAQARQRAGIGSAVTSLASPFADFGSFKKGLSFNTPKTD